MSTLLIKWSAQMIFCDVREVSMIEGVEVEEGYLLSLKIRRGRGGV